MIVAHIYVYIISNIEYLNKLYLSILVLLKGQQLLFELCVKL